MKITFKDRLKMSYIEMAIHFNLMSFILEVSIFSLAMKFSFQLKILLKKKFFYKLKMPGIVVIGFMGFELVLWIYE